MTYIVLDNQNNELAAFADRLAALSFLRGIRGMGYILPMRRL